MSNRNMNLIIEGLSNTHTINESASTSFMPKVERFVGKDRKKDFDFIKKVLDSVYKNLDKDYNGYFECKNVKTKKEKGYKWMTWTMQTNTEVPIRGINDKFDKYFSVVKGIPFDYGFGDYICRGVAIDFDKEDDFTKWALDRGYNPERFHPKWNSYVGVERVAFSNLDNKKEGTTFRFFVSVPVEEK